jgi:hypothetical protein
MGNRKMSLCTWVEPTLVFGPAQLLGPANPSLKAHCRSRGSAPTAAPVLTRLNPADWW